ncbi:MAG: TRAP transporter fused permease subunit [SAR324 cluster bacterium]|nr:TRAP transporter fused permease subunit [SAR324 cluster bacterium]
MNSTPPDTLSILDRILEIAIPVVAILMIAFHAVIVWYPLFGGVMNQNAHLGFCLVLSALVWARATSSPWGKLVFLLGLVVSLAIVIYLAVHYERLDMEAGFPEPLDVAVGITLILIVMAATWKGFGALFPVLVSLAISYALFGQYLPGIMGHTGFDIGFIVSSLSVGFQGIFGMLMNVSVSMLFLLVIFGSTFGATGINSFFMEFGKMLGRVLPGGSGHMAIFSSSLVGMINGAAGANVAITGSFTIPVMKKAGFKNETAGGIEAMASTGGQITPPIMGIAVFVMAGFLGVTYSELMTKAVVPAIFYYAIAILGVIVIANREKLPPVQDIVNRSIIAAGAPVFIIPITVLTAIMINQYSAGYAAFWSTIVLLIVSCLRKKTRPKIKVLIRDLIDGAIMASTFGVAIGCIGMMIKVLTFTAGATKLSMIISSFSGGNLPLLLFLIMALSIFLSASMPPVIAYIIVAFVAAPILTQMGIPLITAHFFVFYFAVMSAVTPPVAGAALVACKIAKAGYLSTSWEAFKLAGPFYLLPFFFINNPVILGGAQPLVQAVTVLIALSIALGAMICFFQGYCLVRTELWERTGYLATALIATAFGFNGQIYLFGIAAAILAMLLTVQWRRYKSTKRLTPEVNGAFAK